MTWVDLPVDFDAHSLAEFIEAELLVGDDDYFSASELRSLFPAGRQPTDLNIEDCLAELTRRDGAMGALYPYAVVDSGVAIDRAEASGGVPYFVMLLLSLRDMPVRTEAEYARSDPIFDEISRMAFGGVVGDADRAVSFGWPPRGDRPSKFPKAVEWIAGLLEVPLRGGEIPEEPRDAGVDVIAWRPYPDGRNSFLIVLVQNTVQFAFKHKSRDVDPSQWRDWLAINNAPDVGFAVPFLIPIDDIWWYTASLNVTFTLDRSRIMWELRNESPADWPAHAAIEEFVQSEIAAYRQRLDVDPRAAVPRRRKKRSR